jgi:hypothetical protein
MKKRYLVTITEQNGRLNVDVDRADVDDREHAFLGASDVPITWVGPTFIAAIRRPLGGTGDSTATRGLRHLLREVSGIIFRDFRNEPAARIREPVGGGR